MSTRWSCWAVSVRWDERSAGRLLEERRYRSCRSQSAHTPAIAGWRIGSAVFNLSAGKRTERDEPKHQLDKTGCNKMTAEQNVSENKRDFV